jgi:hypothetical protein
MLLVDDVSLLLNSVVDVLEVVSDDLERIGSDERYDPSFPTWK